MKKIFTCCILMAFCYIANAQNNLQFNQVITIKADTLSNCSGTCPDTIMYRTFTVAPNKVLKIESINFIAPGNYQVFLDATPFSKVSTGITNTFPIWLPAGTYSIYCATYVSTSSIIGNFAYLLSAIEFNVVP